MTTTYERISDEWDRQTEKYPKLFESFAKEDSSILQQHISIDSIRDYIDQLESAWKYAAIGYHIETANNPVSYETEKANQYAITLIKMHDILMPLDRDTIERIILEIEGQIIGQSDKQRKTDLKAVRTITEDFLNIDNWANSTPI